MGALAVSQRLPAFPQSQGHRPVLWCLIDFASVASTQLAVHLFRSWGPGILSLHHQDTPDSDHGLSRTEAIRIQQCSVLRVWPGGTSPLDSARILDALNHGCLPLEMVPAEHYAKRVADVPFGMDVFVLPMAPGGMLQERLSEQECARRLQMGFAYFLNRDQKASILERQAA